MNMQLGINKTVIRLCAILVVITNLNACDGGGSGGDSDPTGMAAGFVGRWLSVCIDAGGGTYVVHDASYNTDGSLLEIVDFYSDATCSTATGLVKTNIGTYSIGNTITTSSGLTAFEIDIVYTDIDLSGTALPVPVLMYTIFRVDGDILYPGLSTAPPATPGDRPTDLDFTNLLNRI